jgi:membrane-associated phospholipid phosphatase
MNPFDVGILRCLNQFAHHSQGFDRVMAAFAHDAVFQGWVMVAVFWWVWFQPGNANLKNRKIVLATMVGAVLGVVVGRLLADFLPFRVRPLISPELGLVLPYGISADPFRTWSSFPSDHAMVFFAMSSGLWYVSKTLGAGLTLYVACMIAFPRVYLGFHYPTDIIGGALFGVLFAYVANIDGVQARLAAPAMRWLDAHPASFYTCFFLFSMGLASLFEPLRELAGSLLAI